MHDGKKIKLYVREREIPFPFEVQEGVKLDAERFLKPDRPPLIGEFDLGSVHDDAVSVVAEPLPSRGSGGTP